jgi:hypothetical protein
MCNGPIVQGACHALQAAKMCLSSVHNTKGGSFNQAMQLHNKGVAS